MSERDNQNLATWIGALAGVVSAASAAATVYIVSADDATGRSDGLVWPILALIEAGVIAGLALFVLRQDRVSLPRGIAARSPSLMEALFRAVSRNFEAQLAEVKRSRLSLYGRQVLDAQIFLMDYCRSKESRERRIEATDIIQKLDLWKTRKAYLAANKRFTEAGGEIRRIFLIQADLIKSDDDAHALWSIFEDHRAIGVMVSLHLLDFLAPEYHEDFVIYSKDCVLVETQQGDVDFARGKVTAFFDAGTIDEYRSKFSYLDQSNDTRAASEVLAAYASAFIHGSGPVGFEEKKKAFLESAR